MPKRFVEALEVFGAIAGVALLGIVISSPRVKAEDDDRNRREDKVRIGFEIAPVRLNLDGKDRELVGLGSYIVNGQSDCNGCHQGPGPTYLQGGNPYAGEHPTKINPAVYLSGGQDFGTLDPDGLSAHIFPRNLTPDFTGLPEGGHTLEEFIRIMRTGVDLDHLHPTCKGGVLTSGCVPSPFKGALLQIMPWPTFGNMTDHDLEAIWTYLSAIPCVANDPKLVPPWIVNVCP